MSTAGRCMARSTSSGTVVGPGMARNSRPDRTLIVRLWLDGFSVSANSNRRPMRELCCRALLLIEAEVRDVVILHHVGLRLDAHLVRVLGGCFTAGSDQVVV